mmetsp:Transcript_19326/g.51056  ORF Transcript_19326/g.51056 Transcript_19326/m.51056 type:complete len:232 (-) Transcript_19326:46-741(-)
MVGVRARHHGGRVPAAGRRHVARRAVLAHQGRLPGDLQGGDVHDEQGPRPRLLRAAHAPGLDEVPRLGRDEAEAEGDHTLRGPHRLEVHGPGRARGPGHGLPGRGEVRRGVRGPPAQHGAAGEDDGRQVRADRGGRLRPDLALLHRPAHRDHPRKRARRAGAPADPRDRAGRRADQRHARRRGPRGGPEGDRPPGQVPHRAGRLLPRPGGGAAADRRLQEQGLRRRLGLRL